MTRKYTAFTKAFKLETLQSANQAYVCIASLARDLGIRRNMIYKWRYQLNKNKIKIVRFLV
jgi:transposase